MQISTVFYLHLNQPYPILPKNTPLHPLNILPLSWYCLSATQFIQLPLPLLFLLCCQNLVVQGTCSTSATPIPVPSSDRSSPRCH